MTEIKGLQEVIELVERIEGAITKEMAQQVAYDYERLVKKRIQAGPNPALAPLTVATRRKNSSKPLNNSGRLLNSIRSTVTEKTVEVGSDLLYARIHEYGGTIKAKKQFLWIPANQEVARYAETYGVKATIDYLKKKYKFWVGKKAAFIQTGKSAKSTKIAFILKKSVTIPKRSYLRPQKDDEWVFSHAFEQRTGLKT